MRVMMIPHAGRLQKGVSGIHTVVKSWFKHLPYHGVELVPPTEIDFDLMAVHAGMSNKISTDAPLIVTGKHHYSH